MLELKRPLDPMTISVLSDISYVSRRLKVPYVVVGAMARTIVFENVLGRAVRGTRDIDFVIAVDSWDEFDRFIAALVDLDAYEQAPRQRHRVTHRPSMWSVDIIPAGGVQGDDGSIEWPPDRSFVMSGAGLREAIDHALDVRIAPNLVVPVASVPALCILKLIAWKDRRADTLKDAQDLYRILTEYEFTPGVDEQLYEGDRIVLLERADYDLTRAAVALLGTEVRHLAAESSLRKLSSILSPDGIQLLAGDMARSQHHDESVLTRGHLLLEDFLFGLLSA